MGTDREAKWRRSARHFRDRMDEGERGGAIKCRGPGFLRGGSRLELVRARHPNGESSAHGAERINQGRAFAFQGRGP